MGFPTSLVSFLVSPIARGLILFAYAILFAAVEIEIEGPHGWAEKLPTWFRRRPWYARVYARLLSGKPITGYHVTMFLLALFSFHLGFAFGQPWSFALEARVLAAFLVWAPVWDFLWFVFNPHFGWSRFRKGQIWWHGQTWVWRIPIDYVNGLCLSLMVAAGPWLFGGSIHALVDHVVFCALLIVLCAIAVFCAPIYWRWYHHMRRPDVNEPPLG